jgi:hypothetical protein
MSSTDAVELDHELDAEHVAVLARGAKRRSSYAGSRRAWVVGC